MNNFDMDLTKKLGKEYLRSTKKEKDSILSEYIKLTDTKRNTAIQRFNRFSKRKPISYKKKRGRKKIFHQLHKNLVEIAWRTSGMICAELLHPVLNDILDDLQKHSKTRNFSSDVFLQTKLVSLGTLKLIVKDFPKTSSRRNKSNDQIYKRIPVKADFNRHSNETGFVEVDYVEHNGGNSSGKFAVTATYIDIGLQWIQRSAALGKSTQEVELMHERNVNRFPFYLKEFHPDNQKSTLKYLYEKMQNDLKYNFFTISRSRPYKKNDNAHVEQKNFDKVRKVVGYYRFDTNEEVELMNELYEVEDLISNYFIPNYKLIEKIYNDKGKLVKKIYEKPKTAYRRIMKSKKCSIKQKYKVYTVKKSLSLVELRQKSNEIKHKLFNLSK